MERTNINELARLQRREFTFEESCGTKIAYGRQDLVIDGNNTLRNMIILREVLVNYEYVVIRVELSGVASNARRVKVDNLTKDISDSNVYGIELMINEIKTSVENLINSKVFDYDTLSNNLLRAMSYLGGYVQKGLAAPEGVNMCA